MSDVFNLSLIYATIRSATPILFAALCATITQQADILNIGTEGIMLTSAFVAVLTSFMTGSDLNIEQLLSLEPDVVFYTAGNTQLQSALENAGIPAVGVSPTKRA